MGWGHSDRMWMLPVTRDHIDLNTFNTDDNKYPSLYINTYIYSVNIPFPLSLSLSLSLVLSFIYFSDAQLACAQAAPSTPTSKRTPVRPVFLYVERLIFENIMQWFQRLSRTFRLTPFLIVGAVLDCAVADITPLCPQFRCAGANRTSFFISIILVWVAKSWCCDMND